MFSYQRVTPEWEFYVHINSKEIAGPFKALTQATAWLRKNVFAGTYFEITRERVVAKGVV